jgi:hypothetical protein
MLMVNSALYYDIQQKTKFLTEEDGHLDLTFGLANEHLDGGSEAPVLKTGIKTSYTDKHQKRVDFWMEYIPKIQNAIQDQDGTCYCSNTSVLDVKIVKLKGT